MAKIVSRLFAISPGEEKKTILLYALHFVLFLGQSWGALACLTLFLDNWPAEDLSFMFIGSAVIMFVVGLAYSSFADRVSNFRLLLFIVLITALWLLSVRVLLATNGGPFGLVYPYFYLVYDLVRDVSVLHLLTYTNGFYNTRSAKQAMPVVLSGGLAGNMVAGFTVALLGRWIGLENIPLVWLGMMVVATLIIFVVQRRFGSRADAAKTVQAAPKTQTKQRVPNSLVSLQEGYAYVRSSSLLRWLALAAFGMMLLMNVLMYQASEIFQIRYVGNPEGLLRFYGLFTGISSLVGVVIQTFFINRVITAIGVGTSSMIFPTLTGLAVTLLGLFPSFPTAIFGSVTQITLRRAVQAPIDAITYNCLPPDIKGRSRAFILGLVIPLGALAGGLLLLGVRQGVVSVSVLFVAGILIAGIYIFAMLRVRREYSHAFARLLADGEMAFLASGQDAFTRPDPSVINALTARLLASDSPELTVFLAEMLYELQGPASFQQLRDIALADDPIVEAELIKLLGREWIGHPTVLTMCMDGLRRDQSTVQIAAVRALATLPEIHATESVLAEFRRLVHAPDDSVCAAVLPTLLRSDNAADKTLAQAALDKWLTPEADRAHRMLALNALAESGDEALLERVKPFILDPAETVRRQALRLLGGLIDKTDDAIVRRDALALLVSFLSDADEFVRLAAVKTIGDLRDPSTGPALWPLLSEPDFAIRQQACLAFPPTMQNALQDAATDADPLLAESAAYVLVSTLGQTRHTPLIHEHITARLHDIATLQRHVTATAVYTGASGRLLGKAMTDQIDELEEQVYWLLGALCGRDEIGAIRRQLAGENDATRANAAEALESVTSPAVRRQLIALCTVDPTPTFDAPDRASSSQTRAMLDPKAVMQWIWPEYDSGAPRIEISPRLAQYYATEWMKAIGIHVVLDEVPCSRVDPQNESGHTPREGREQGRRRTGRSVFDMLDASTAREPSPAEETIAAALTATAADRRPMVQEALVRGRRQRSRTRKQEETESMLTVIERVLFLKEVPFFADMSIDQLRVLAAISEEIDCGPDETVAAKGELADTLYVIVQGKMAIQSVETSARGQTSVRRIATLAPRDYFGEMAIFDNQPYGSNVIAIAPTKLLAVRQRSLLALIELHPDLALSLLRVFSLRLRHFMALAEARTSSKPKQLMDLYDQFE